MIAHPVIGEEETDGPQAPESLYPIASFVGSLFSNPDATNTALYNTFLHDSVLLSSRTLYDCPTGIYITILQGSILLSNRTLYFFRTGLYIT